MEINKNPPPSKILTYSFALCLIFMTISIVNYPKTTFDAAISGINLWWNVIFPSLLPFFILSELLMGIGIVNALGVFLEPLMRPIFNVPGVGALALYPIRYRKTYFQTSFIYICHYSIWRVYNAH